MSVNISPYINFRHFYEPSSYAEQRLVVSDGMGYESNPAFLIDRNYFNNNLIMFVVCGALYVEQFGKKHRVIENQGILMELTQKHKYYFDKSCKSHIIWFHFRGKPCQELINDLNINKKMPMIFTGKWVEKEIYSIFEIAKSEDRTKEFAVSSKIYSVILEITKQSILEIQTKSSNYSSFKQEVDSYLSANTDTKLTLDDIAKHFNLSRYHFCRSFKEQFNTTLFDYIKIKKIETAKKMLLYTSDSISDISNYLNFYDQGYFSNVFKSVVGCSPRKFRARQTTSHPVRK